MDTVIVDEAKPKTLADVPLSKIYEAQQAALMRLQLYAIGVTHQILSDFSQKARGYIIGYAGSNGHLDSAGLYQIQQAILSAWDQAYMETWLPFFQAARREAASIPFGTLAIYHEQYLQPAARQIEEQIGATSGPVFEPQLQAVIDAANQRIYGDGLQLSSRIWKLDREARDEINRTLMAGISEQKSAWDIAKDLEQYLGANQDCPRWTYTRLSKLTKKDIASGDRRGLVTGADCKGQGVSYNALRLARTEMQAVHAIATDTIMDAQPWIQQEQVVLSPAHPQDDICDDAANAGPQPKGTYILPLHPNCVTPGQLIETNRGRVAIEQIQAGDLVLTHTGSYKPVIKTWKHHFSGIVYKIASTDKSMELTGNHPVLLRRGWVNAELVQLGDEIADASGGVLANRTAGVSEYAPSLAAKPFVSASIFLGVPLVPPGTIHFNSYLDGRNSEIDEVTPNFVFALVRNAGVIKSMLHRLLPFSRIGESHLSMGFKHGHKPRVGKFLGRRNLFAYIRSLCRISVARIVKYAHRFLHLLAGGPTPCSVVSFPCRFDRFAHRSHWNTAQFQQISKHPVCQPIASKDFRRPKFFGDINIIQKRFERATVFGFDPELVEFDHREPMSTSMGADDACKSLSANGASNHDNLLSSSPDGGWGAGSGSPVVGELARPALALLNYTKVQSVSRQRYTGPVYNLSVLDDNSYFVNDMAVHNCLCYKSSVLMGEDEFIASLKIWVRDGADPGMNKYTDFVGIPKSEVLQTSFLGSIIAQALSVWLWSQASELAKRLGQ